MSKTGYIELEKKETKIYKVTQGEKWHIDFSEEFSQIYETAEELLSNINKASTFKLLFWCLKNMNKENIVYINTKNKIELMYEKKISLSTIDKCIIDLINNNAIERINKGEYRINVLCFWRSNPEIRKTRIKELLIDVEKGERDEKFLGTEVKTIENKRYGE